MKVLFLTRALNVGGAERQLVVLARGLRKRGHEVAVAVFYPGGLLEAELKDVGIPILSLAKRGRWDLVGFVLRLIQMTRRYRPDVLHSYISNLVTVVVQPFLTSTKIVWGVRSSYMDFSRYDWLFRVSYGLACRLSHSADLIIANSHAGRRGHVADGYPADKMVVIPNGIDIERFRPSPEARVRIRGEWGLSEDALLIGMVGRLDPMKDVETFLSAAAAVASTRHAVHFVCVGDGHPEYKAVLQEQARTLGLADRVRWTGTRTDVADVYSALDLLVNCSYGEGFSNVIGEAMACGIPCIATDVGDSGVVLGSLGEVVEPKNVESLVQGIERLLRRRPAPAQIRQRIIDHFSLDALVLNTERELLALCGSSSGNRIPAGENQPVC
ncbi:MAG: D-inositol-3-phosphate glycosyltransferase [Nitrospirae bacterium]|nr:MAG: putative lipopolysaccharide core biosynthesis glycosyltransferase [Nitrospira sp. OLB3]MBV6470820.1 D-inositol-3-phosphate glycosyltransferase [Nitrospirota bacterium]MCE7964717.1 glycosyltransferase [Nitrospira sp. NTP2]MCK6494343.1 glycosyltransferase [Nitrospira sp.]MEB2337846.1 glycosyltransferase [Nitrospirales bacterium]